MTTNLCAIASMAPSTPLPVLEERRCELADKESGNCILGIEVYGAPCGKSERGEYNGCPERLKFNSRLKANIGKGLY